MAGLEPRARAFVWIGLVLWLGGVALYASDLVRGRIGRHTLLVTQPQDSNAYPVIRGVRLRQDLLSIDSLAAGDPKPAIGDQILRVGARDLRGAGQLRFDALTVSQTGADLRVALTLDREGQRLETWVEAWRPPSALAALPGLVTALAWGGTGLALILRASHSRAARLLGAGGILFSLPALFPPIAVGPAIQHYVWSALRIAFVAINGVFVLKGLLWFPDDSGPEHRLARVWPWIFFVAFSITLQGDHTGFLVPAPLAGRVNGALNAAIRLAGLGILAWKFVAASPIGRRRLKWVLVAAYLGIAPSIATNVVWLLQPEWIDSWNGRIWTDLAVGLTPLGFLIAVLRFNLLDIDRVISATAAYTIVGIALLAGLLAALPPAAAAVSGWLGMAAGTSQLALSLAAATIAVPVAQRLRPQIERAFFADRYRMEQGMRALIEELPTCREPRRLIELAAERLNELLRPESCVVYGRQEGDLTPIFVRGRGGPPGFQAASPLIGVLEQRTAPVAIERFARRGTTPALTPFDRAALETLEAAVVVPIHRRGAGMVALVALGPKLSGDVYTSTDLTLLAALSQQVSSELLRFEQEEVARQADALRESLRVYVPGAVQEQLERGQTLAGEREVTVLFVDIRGYTAFAEDREAAEIFSAVNRYTRAVSEIVRKHEGHVVEFNGDGMMALFGAPQDLPGKEREAVKAALEIHERMRGLGPQTAEGRPLSVGIGIATGSAFVGSVQAADRAIWTALGNTTNLASRLQSLTRDLDACVVIDEATRAAAGPVAADFERRERVEIRGRREPIDLYFLAV